MAIYNGDDNNNSYSGTIDADTINGFGGNDSLFGNDGNDSIVGGTGNDTLDGANGNDTVVGGDGNDLLYGWTGDDLLVGQGTGPDSMYGESGNDSFDLNTIADLTGWIISGGANTDTADMLSGFVQLGTALPFFEVEQLDTLGTVFVGTAGGDSYDFSSIATIAFGLPYQLVVVAGDGNDTVTGTNAAWADGLHVIDGQGGNDSLVGGTARDSLIGGEGNDSLNGGGGSGADVLAGGNGNDTLNGGGGTDAAYGEAGDDYVVAVIGIDTADGGDGTDTLDTSLFGGAYAVNLVTGATNFFGESFVNFEHLISGAGNDTLTGTTGANRVDGGAGADSVAGDDGDDTLLGNAANDTLLGGAGNDSLDGGLGTDSMDGGAGDDVYLIDDAGDVAAEQGTDAGGIDTVYAAVDTTAGVGIDGVVLTGAAVNAQGNAGANRLEGQGISNVLGGGSGNDTLLGQGGNDTLAGGINDDFLDGGDSADSMDGGDGNDVYIVDSVFDMVYEVFNDVPGGTSDTIRSTVSYAIGDLIGQRGYGIERLELLGSADIDATGNSNSNTMSGNAGANEMRGGAGDDIVTGGAGDDTLTGGVGYDSLGGDDGNDVLAGGAGDDTLVGGTGADVLAGGAGADTYYVDDVLDVVQESVDPGVDLVVALVSYTLGNGVENLLLDGALDLNGAGNAAANALYGNNGNNRLDGGLGADTMQGGAGRDTYVVNEAGDVIAETGSNPAEIDGVIASIAWTLGDNLESLFLTGSAAINGVGNALKNTLTGNSAANTLSGLAGNDTLDGGGGADSLVGGSGNDTYVVNVAGDKTVETGTAAAEVDLVRAGLSWTLAVNVEQLLLTGTGAFSGTGNAGANRLTGNTGANTLSGQAGKDTLDGAAGSDILDGGLGNDSLIGGTGTDTFRFTTALNATTNVDAVSAFSHADDRFLLDDAVFAGIGAVGALAVGAFRIGSGALDADDRIIYNQAQGKLYFDKDGFGGTGPVLFATVAAGADVRADDFFVS